MIGLIWKDFLVMRKGLYVYVPLCAGCYALLAWLDTLNFAFIFSSIQLILVILPLSTFYQDEQAGWERCAMCLPLGCRAVVGARYLFILGLALVTAATSLTGFAAVRLLGREDLAELAIVFLVSLAVSLVMEAVLLPLSYKLKAEQARVCLYILIVLLAVSLSLMVWFDLLDPYVLEQMDERALADLTRWLAPLPLAGLAALFPSYRISCRIAAGKEY